MLNQLGCITALRPQETAPSSDRYFRGPADIRKDFRSFEIDTRVLSMTWIEGLTFQIKDQGAICSYWIALLMS